LVSFRNQRSSYEIQMMIFLARIELSRTKEYEDRFLSRFIAAECGYIDDVIMPHSTRRRIAWALAMLRDKKMEILAKKHGNLPF
jgi:acetyl-CoA carboxylase carboxyltransferase component